MKSKDWEREIETSVVQLNIALPAEGVRHTFWVLFAASLFQPKVWRTETLKRIAVVSTAIVAGVELLGLYE